MAVDVLLASYPVYSLVNPTVEYVTRCDMVSLLESMAYGTGGH